MFEKKDKLPVRNNNNNRYAQRTQDTAQETQNTETAQTTQNAEKAPETQNAEAKVQENKEEDEDAPLPEDKKEEAVEGAEPEGDGGYRPTKRAMERTWVEDPFIPLTPELKDILSLYYYYSIFYTLCCLLLVFDECVKTMKHLEEYYGFSTFPLSQMFTRSVKNHKVYYVTESIAELINKVQDGPKTGLSIINSGVKLFNRHEVSKHGYRICQARTMNDYF